MKIAVAVFPGSNCEHDVEYALGLLGADVELMWHQEHDLSGFSAVVLPGGFAHGDYLRTGAIARFSPIMDEVARMAKEGLPVLGICNGFQILCEADLLPGALVANRDLNFICSMVHVRVESTAAALTRDAEVGQVLRIPLNSYEGNFVADAATLDELEAAGRILLRYCDEDGNVTDEANPNGSARNIAAIAGPGGNVVGIMPHPERAAEDLLGSSDGRILLSSFVHAAEEASR